MKTPFIHRWPGVLSAALVFGTAAAAEAQEPPKSNFQLQHRSAFAAPKNVQKENPFWPIGWVPSPETQIASSSNEEAPTVTASSFVLSSVLLGAEPQLAVINGHEYTVGDKVPVTGGDAKAAAASSFRAQVMAIRDGEAVLRYGSRDIVVALKIR